MSALFNFQAFLTTICLFICLCSYLKYHFPQYIDRSFNHGFKGLVRKGAVIGDRLSPYVSCACIGFAVANILIR